MSMLARKLRRDLWHYRGQMVSVVAVMAAGIALFVALRSMHGYLRGSQEDYYRRQRFADVFVRVERAPESVAREVARIPGVVDVEARVVADVILDVPGDDGVVTGRLVSIPDRARGGLNAVHVARGRFPERRDEVVMSVAFARAHRLDVGARIGAVVNGRMERFRVVGLGQSPEFVYEIRGGTDLFPDNRRFGVIWVGHAALAAAFDLEGAFNDLAIGVSPGADTRAILERVDELTERYGGLGAHDREDQVSHRFVSDEIQETRVTSVIIPSIFLGVTAFLLHIVLSRLVGVEREQIAVLRAFGFPARRIVAHYLAFACAPVAAGGVAGVLLGLLFARRLAGVYGRFFQFPFAQFTPDAAVIATAVAVSAAAVLVGGASAVRAVLRLPPAEAMRPPVPPSFRRGLSARLGLDPHLSRAARMVVRNLERRPGKTAAATVGIALALALLVVGGYSFGALEHIKNVQFHVADRWDLSVVFNQPRAAGVRHDLARIPGVSRVEMFRAVPVRLRHGPRVETTAILGTEPGAELRRVVDRRVRPVTIRDDGLTLTDVLAAKLGVVPGDEVDVEILEGDRRRVRARVVTTVDEMVGTSAYLSMDALHRLAGGPRQASGAFLRVDASRQSEVRKTLAEMPAVSGVVERKATLAAFERTVQESFRISLGTIVAFAVLIATGIVYNSGRISLSERARELASLRVLGFTRGETAAMFLGEQAVLTVMAIPLGLLFGYGFCALLTLRAQSELFRFPLIVDARTYAAATAVVAASALLTSLALRERVQHLDLVEVLKARE
jgi:putative ABC transport system permease protein